MGRFRFGAALLFGCVLGCRPVMADTAILRNKPALLRMSYEVLDVGPDETMGLAGVNYLVNINSDWYVGASGYGALQGERGAGYSYAQLEQLSNRWAQRLRRYGVGPEVKVGLCLRRSPDMILAALAISKAGGAYVALDPRVRVR